MIIVPNNVRDIAFASRLFYFSLHGLGWFVLLAYQSELHRELANFQFYELTWWIFKVGIASYFFMVCGKNTGQHYPGILDKKCEEIELGTNSPPISVIGSLKQTIFSGMAPTEDSNQQFMQEQLLEHKVERPSESFASPGKASEQRGSFGSVNASEKTDLPERPDRRFCEECFSTQPFRTKHCHQCQRCIPKFDHHCFWIGGCVGELNHRLFWAFLVTQTWVNLSAMLSFLRAMDFHYTVDPVSGSETYTKPYYIMASLAFICFCFMLFTLVLAVYHSALLSIGSSTWEHTKRDSISYLKSYPKYYHPFNYGLVRNIKFAFFHGNQLRQWQVPTFSEAEQLALHQFNWIDNQYYSCC